VDLSSFKALAGEEAKGRLNPPGAHPRKRRYKPKKEEPMAEAQKKDKSAEEQAKYQPQPSVQPTEPEDPSAGGNQQEAQKQALHHNVNGGQGQQHPAAVPAQHATGSFTDKK
jgi:hypothetical protein